MAPGTWTCDLYVPAGHLESTASLPRPIATIRKSLLHGSELVEKAIFKSSVPYNRPVCRQKVKSFSENQHNSWPVQDKLMTLRMLTQLIKMYVVGKNENSCSFRFLAIWPFNWSLSERLSLQLFAKFTVWFVAILGKNPRWSKW